MPSAWRANTHSGQFGSQFVADVPELRPYGRATEPVALRAVVDWLVAETARC